MLYVSISIILFIRISAANWGPETADLTLLPTLWFRNTWSWGYENGPMGGVPGKPRLWADGKTRIIAEYPALGRYTLHAETPASLIFTDNETNTERPFGVPNPTPFVKDAFHRALIHGESGVVNPAQEGTEAAVHYQLTVPAGETAVIGVKYSKKHPCCGSCAYRQAQLLWVWLLVDHSSLSRLKTQERQPI